MRLYLGEKVEFREKFQFYRRSLISCGLCVSFNMKVFYQPRKSPLNIEIIEFVNECESLVFLVVLPNFQKLIKQFLLFYYSCIYISVKKKKFRENF